ncbi:MAG: GNAT family N-acetyltransferase, partial [Chloroflexi bacterium]
MSKAPTLSRTYPWITSVNSTDVTFRLMTPDDRDEILDFARSLPSEDLLFLRTDITQEKTVDAWMAYLKSGRTISLAAEIDGRIAGYASIHLNEALWARHVGEMRVLISRDQRGLGLGKRLTNEAFGIAKDLKLRKVTAQMATDQRGARSV